MNITWYFLGHYIAVFVASLKVRSFFVDGFSGDFVDDFLQL